MYISNKNINGFTLIEVLISMVILGIGILGVLALQGRALMDNQDAYLRTQAIFLAYDMSDKIKANFDYWKKPNIISQTLQKGKTYTINKHPACSSYDPPKIPANNPCTTSSQMAEYDVYRWEQNVITTLPNSSIDLIDNPDNSITLVINWDRANQDTNKKMGAASYSMVVKL